MRPPRERIQKEKAGAKKPRTGICQYLEAGRGKKPIKKYDEVQEKQGDYVSHKLREASKQAENSGQLY